MEEPVSAIPQPAAGRKLFYGLFIFPLLIAVGMAVLLCTVVLLTKESETPESLITAIKTGAPSKRWQKAFELSNEINQGRGLIRESGVMKEVMHILTQSQEYDGKTRAYMAVALSRFQEPEVVPALREALKKEEDPSVQLYLIWALGIKKDKTSTAEILPYIRSEDEDLRKMAAYVLGILGDPKVSPQLEVLLSDTSRDVRWNAALALANLGSEAGYPAIKEMLDRPLLEAQQIPEGKIEEIMVNAVRGAVLLKKPEMLPLLAELSNSDKSLKVRQAAMDALEIRKAPLKVQTKKEVNF